MRKFKKNSENHYANKNRKINGLQALNQIKILFFKDQSKVLLS